MAPADLNVERLRRPFSPFRLVMEDGTTYEVRDPALFMVGTATCIVGYPSARQPFACERYDYVSTERILRVEHHEGAD